MKIAHRGGFVTETLPENSFSALEEAIRRGYSHVEIDARITRRHLINKYCTFNDKV
jgi:glycerophosphoryl diester phosphodiesterase